MEYMMEYVVKEQQKQNNDGNTSASFLTKDKDLMHFPLNNERSFDLNEIKLERDERFNKKLVGILLLN